MRAVVWQGKRDVRVEEVPDPVIQDPGDAIIRVTSTNICGSDLHLYEVLGSFMHEGDILGHEPMGIVEEVGADVTAIAPGDRVVIPFQVCCGTCWMCEHGLQSQCETTQVREQDSGAALFGYSELYGSVPGGQAEFLRVPQAQYTHIKVPDGPSDDRFVYLSDVLPTAWQAVAYADPEPEGTLLVLGLGPIGDMACRIALHRGVRQVIGVDLVDARLDRARARGVTTLDLREVDDVATAVRDLTGGRGADAVVDAVGMEAHGSPVVEVSHKLVAALPDVVARKLMTTVGIDRLAAVRTAVDAVRRGGTISLSGVYGGMADPMPMMTLFDKQVQLRMGQANVKRWVPEILPLLTDDDPLGVDDFATHRLPLDAAPGAYADFQAKKDGMVKVVLKPRWRPRRPAERRSLASAKSTVNEWHDRCTKWEGPTVADVDDLLARLARGLAQGAASGPPPARPVVPRRRGPARVRRRRDHDGVHPRGAGDVVRHRRHGRVPGGDAGRRRPGPGTRRVHHRRLRALRPPRRRRTRPPVAAARVGLADRPRAARGARPADG